jgi:hypothetical protein
MSNFYQQQQGQPIGMADPTKYGFPSQNQQPYPPSQVQQQQPGYNQDVLYQMPQHMQCYGPQTFQGLSIGQPYNPYSIQQMPWQNQGGRLANAFSLVTSLAPPVLALIDHGVQVAHEQKITQMQLDYQSQIAQIQAQMMKQQNDFQAQIQAILAENQKVREETKAEIEKAKQEHWSVQKYGATD